MLWAQNGERNNSFAVQVVVKGASGLPLDEEVATLIRVRERLLEARTALVDVQRPSCMEEGIVEPALRLAVTSLHSAKDLEAFGIHLQVCLRSPNPLPVQHSLLFSDPAFEGADAKALLVRTLFFCCLFCSNFTPYTTMLAAVVLVGLTVPMPVCIDPACMWALLIF